MNAYVPKGVRTRKAWKFIVVWLVGQQKRSFEKLRGVSFSDSRSQHVKKNKSRGNLVGKIKVSLPEGKYENFRQKQFVQYQVLHKLCSIPDQLGPFSRLINF